MQHQRSTQIEPQITCNKETREKKKVEEDGGGGGVRAVMHVTFVAKTITLSERQIDHHQ